MTVDAEPREGLLSEAQFDERFTLVKNEVEGGACNGEYRFETFGPDFEFIRKVDNKKLWTCVDTCEGWYYVPGFHLVNRLYYLVTEEEWTDDIVEVALEDLNDG